MMAVFFIAHEKGLKFHAQPHSGAYSCYDCRCLTPSSIPAYFHGYFISRVRALCAIYDIHSRYFAGTFFVPVCVPAKIPCHGTVGLPRSADLLQKVLLMGLK